MYQIAICDDEKWELDKVEQMLKDYNVKSAGGEFLIRRFANSEDILLQITKGNYQPDLILLDIYMPGSSGMETARKLRDMGNNCRIVFMTLSQEHALEAFGVDVFSYLVKPAYKDGFLRINAVNKEGNSVWFLVRVYQGEKKIAQTGILHPGEYIAEVECSQALKAGDSIMVQMVAYEPETYHSEGVARIACDVAEE